MSAKKQSVVMVKLIKCLVFYQTSETQYLSHMTHIKQWLSILTSGSSELHNVEFENQTLINKLLVGILVAL